MTREQKYIRTPDDEIIIFPSSIEHNAFKKLNPISAGFCEVGQNNIRCYGWSFSLGLDSKPDEDTFQATMQLFGVKNALNLKERKK